jgi:PAS domain S-box-containing protein
MANDLEKKISILIVDDNPNNLLVLEAILDPLNYNLVRALSGREALESILKQEFALILLDVQMPIMDGFETATLIRGMENALHTPIIFITAIYQDNAYASKGYSIGAVDYLLKPIDRQLLLAKVEVFVDLYHERKRAEQKLKESQELFKTMADSAPVLIWMSGTDAHCNFFNKPWLDFTGRILEQEVGNGWAEGVHPDDRKHCLDFYISFFNERQPFKMEFRLRRADGKYRWVLNTGVPRFTPDGTFTGYIGSCIDITEHKLAEEVLKNQQNWLESVLNLAPSPILLIEPATARVIFSNKAADKLAGGDFPKFIPAEEYHTVYYCTDTEGNRIDNNHMPGVRVARGEKLEGVQMDWHTPLGKIPLLISADILPAMHGHSAVAVLVFQDISRLKQVETELRQANQLKDEFLATVSHELRTPLTSILGWSRLLRSGGFDEAATLRALETIERNAKLQARIVDDLLDISKIITGKLALKVDFIDLVPVIEAAIETVRPAAEAKEIKLQMVLDPSAGQVLGDAIRLQQVIWNLLSNSVKFTPRLGSVQIRLERIGSHIEITITDTGKGIESEFLPYVFDRFRQADSSITRTHGGLGLGLALVRHLVELHGGSVHAYSKGQNEGATFIIKLPQLGFQKDSNIKQSDLSAENRALFNLPPELTGVRVLLVDDDPDTLGMLNVTLEQSNAEVKTAASTAEALELMERWMPDVLVSDIGMPGEDGYELIRKIRDKGPNRGGKIPAVALTAFAGEIDRNRILTAGFNKHISKPVEPQDLLVLIAGLLGRIEKRD